MRAPCWIFLLLLCWGAAGCASYCPEVAAIRTALVERKATTEPHLTIAVPLVLASRFVDEEMAQVKPLSLAPPAVALLAKLAGDLDVVASDGALVALGDDRLGLRTKLTVRLDKRSLFSLTVVVRLRASFEARALVLRVHGDDLHTVRPELGDIASDAVGRELGKTALGKLLDEKELAAIANALIQFVGGAGFDLIRDQLLVEIGKVTTIRIDYPPIPIERTTLRVFEGDRAALALQVQTSLPVRAGYTVAHPPDSPSRIGITTTASAMVELGNWAMATNLVPARFNDDMDPDPKGTLEPRLDWTEEHERPLTIHVFTEDPFCARVKVQTRMALRIVDHNFHVDVMDGAVTHVDGSWIVKAGVWLMTVGAGPIEASQRQLARFGFAIGDRSRVVAVEDAHLAIRPDAPDLITLAVALQ